MKIYATNPWPSSIVRGQQIAEQLGCPFNAPESDIQDGEVVVFVKSFNINPISLLQRGCKVYLDVVDTDVMLPLISIEPRINVIAISQRAKEYIKARLPEHRVVVIDEHHCNFDNIHIEKRFPKTVGYIGSKNRIDCIDFIATLLREKGFIFKWLFCEKHELTRQDVVDFYKSIDIQVNYCLPRIIEGMPPELKNPLKLANAASFGIPTVGYPEMHWKDFNAMFEATTPELVVTRCLNIQQLWYRDYSQEFIQEAKRFHISKIVEQYKERIV